MSSNPSISQADLSDQLGAILDERNKLVTEVNAVRVVAKSILKKNAQLEAWQSKALPFVELAYKNAVEYAATHPENMVIKQTVTVLSDLLREWAEMGDGPREWKVGGEF